MALNALRTEVVSFTGTPGITVDNVTVGYKAEYTPRTSTEAKYNAIEGRTSDVASDANHKGQYYIQLGEQLYDGDLRLNNRATDDFGRPSRYWEYDGKAIGTYMKKELIRQEYTNEVTGKDLYDLLGADTIKNYSFDITIDGVAIDGKTGSTVNNTVLTDDAKSYFDENNMVKTNKTKVGQTGKGVLTQVFVNASTEEVDIAVINTYLAKASADYSEKRDELKLDVYGIKNNNQAAANRVWYKETEKCSLKDGIAKDFTVSNEDFDVADVKKGDILMVTQANGEIITIAEPEVIAAATLSAFSKDKYVIESGTQYDYNTTIEYDPDTLDDYTGVSATQQLKDTEYNLYLDRYGYLIGVEVVEAQKNYIFLTGIDQGTSNLNNKVSDAAGILLDGTFINFKMNMIDSKTTDVASNANPDASETFFGHPLWNTWCTYTVDKDGTYTLKEVGSSISGSAKAAQYNDMTLNVVTIDDKRVALKASNTTFAYGNDDSVYIVPEVKTVAVRDEVKGSFVMPDDGSTTNVTTTDGSPGNSKIDIGENAVIISGVESRSTGINNVDLVTWTKSQITAAADTTTTATKVWPGNVYTLYDDDNYIIGAVVVGEDNGASKNWVYVNSGSTKLESYSSADDEWTWVREVISDGVAIDLTEKGSGLSELRSMEQNVWYEVTYKADGSVKAVDHAYFQDIGKSIGGTAAIPADAQLTIDTSGGDTGKSFTDNVNYLENMNVNGKSTYLYEEVWGLGTDAGGVSTGTKPANSHTSTKSAMLENNQPSLVGGTLYVDTAAKKGLYVATDVKSVLIQTNDGSETTTFGENRDDLRNMLDDLNYMGGSYLFKISAVVKDGRATVVVIHDWNEGAAGSGDKDLNPGEGEETGDIDVYLYYRTDKSDAATQVNEDEIKISLSRESNGRLVLTKAKAEEKLPAGYELTGNTFPMELTVADGTSYANAIIGVKKATRTLKLPENYKYSWPADDSADALWEAQAEATVNSTAATDGIPVPVGATVTVKVDGAGSDAFYIKNPVAAADATDAVKYLTQNGAFEVAVTSATAATVDYSSLNATANKYYKVSAAARANIGTLDTSITLASAEIPAAYKKIGESITVTVTGTGKGTAGGATGTITAATVAGMTFNAATNTVTGPADTTDDYASQQFSFELGGNPSARDIAVVFAVN